MIPRLHGRMVHVLFQQSFCLQQQSIINMSYRRRSRITHRGQEFKAIDDAVLALKTGKLDAVAVEGGNGAAIIAKNSDIALSGVLFSVDEASENNVIILNKEDTELLEQVNAILAEAEAAGLYGEWYAEALELAGVESASEVEYDDEGNVVEDGEDADTTGDEGNAGEDGDDAGATDDEGNAE